MGAKTVLAIDPGPVRSAWVLYQEAEGLSFGLLPNGELLNWLDRRPPWFDHFAIEMVACYGMPVGSEVFETCVWIGRFLLVVADCQDHRDHYVYRKDVKMHLCGSMKAKDSNIRQALIDKFGPGRDKAIGTKKAQGPLYGVKKDIWAALAVAVTWMETCHANDDD